MMLTESQKQSFEAAVDPLIKWLNDNVHPHHTVIVEPDGAELVEGQLCVKTTAHIKD